MADTPTRLADCYELAMAIGNSLELVDMFTESLSAYLETLGLVGAVVIGTDAEDDGRTGREVIFSIPPRSRDHAAVPVAIDRLAACENLSRDMPISGKAGSHPYHLFDLPNYGTLLLLPAKAPLREGVLRSLVPINGKLALAARFCGQPKRSDRQIADDHFRQAQVDLEAARRVRDQFLSNISHELRTPINGIVGMAELLHHSVLTRDQADMATTIQRSAKDLVAIIDDMLDYARISSGQLELSPGVTCLHDILKRVERQARLRVGARPIRLRFRVDPAIPSEVRVDGTRLRQVLDHLVDNAVKFSEARQIAVAVDCDGISRHQATLRFSVSDNGKGVPVPFQESIFDVFTQVDDSYRRQHGGTGFGLALCKAVVEKMGGRIVCRSVPGEGATFMFSVAVGLTSGAGLDAESTARVLVAEDNLINRMFTLKILGNLGYQADSVDNGRDALDAICAGDYDIVVLDIQMPKMDGIEVTRRIREDRSGRINPDIPIIALSALSEQEYRKPCLDAGVNVFVAKPTTASEMAELLDTHLLPTEPRPRSEPSRA